MTKKVLVTDYAWPSLEPERAVLARVGAELVVAPDGDEDTLTELARDVDGILTCWAQTTERVIRAAEKCVVVSRYGVGVESIPATGSPWTMPGRATAESSDPAPQVPWELAP